MANAITVPSLRINGDIVQIVPNSLTYQPGEGEWTVSAQSNGYNTIPVFQQNHEKAVGKLTFKVFSTSDNIDQIETVKANNPNNEVTFVDPNSSFVKTMSPAAITNELDILLGVDAQFEVTMMGGLIL